MIELNWAGLINPSSSILCASNFTTSKLFIFNVDIKTRSREIKKEISTNSRPTVMYQMNDDHILVGTEAGNLEVHALWTVGENTLKATINAHPDSQYGITVITPLVSPSELITNERAVGEDGANFIVTAAGDQKVFKIWKTVFTAFNFDMQMHIMIHTSLDNGIHYMLQTGPAQFVCCDNTNVLKFYDFVDNAALHEKQETEKENKAFADLVTAAFNECDVDRSGYLDIEEIKPMCISLIKKFHNDVNMDEKVMLQRMFDWFDQDGSGMISFHEFKVQMMRAFILKKLPDEILQ
jgi:Ca2+-binding EF-hand superfamily protein